MVDLDDDQQRLLAERTTKPIYLVQLGFMGEEFLSSNGNLVFDDQEWIDGDVGVAGLDNWSRARIRLRPTPERVAAAISSEWRGNICRIFAVPAVEFPWLIEDDYVEDDYADMGLITADPILLLDGRLVASEVSDWVELEAVHPALLGLWMPRNRIARPVFNHLVPPGSVLNWEGQRFILEARR